MNNAKNLLKWAVFLLGSCGVLHLLGAREETVVLTGANLGPGSLLGLLYVVSWLAAVAVAPVLLIAAAIEGLSAVVLRRWTARFQEPIREPGLSVRDSLHTPGMDLWLGTLRALLAPTRAIPMGIVVSLLLFEQGRWSRDPRALPVAAALCLSFVLLAPAAWRAAGRWEVGWPLRLSVYGILGITCVSLIGGWLPQAIGVTSSFLTEGGSLSIATALFWVGGWGLGRDIDLELGLLDARRRAIELEREAERARLFALAQHLDPHFLFNTLNAIAEWCHEDSAVAEKAILQLSSMLRTLLGGVQRSSWPLRDELALVSSLVNLHATRDPDMLSLQLREEGDLGAVSVPPMLLLQVVENAIKHGPSRGHRGVIEIAVEVSRGQVSVEVSNPGTFAGERPGGQGLALLRRRLALAYTSATMTIAPRGERTAVSLLLPLKPQDHADLFR